MIIGNGLIAKAFEPYFKEDTNVIIFASGVSNSRLDDDSEYEREFRLIEKTINNLQKEQLLVYFSTISLNDPNLQSNKYIQHKIAFEKYIKQHVKQYLVFRAPNIIGKGGNSANLINYFLESIKNQRKVEIYSGVSRNLLGVDDFARLVTFYIQNYSGNDLVEITYPYNYSAIEIFKEVGDYLGAITEHSVVETKNYEPSINIEIFSICEKCNIPVEKKYLKEIIPKYFG